MMPRDFMRVLQAGLMVEVCPLMEAKGTAVSKQLKACESRQ